MLNQKPLPSDSFTSVRTQEIKLQAESLKGIEIPKPEPVQKKIEETKVQKGKYKQPGIYTHPRLH